MVAPKGNRFWEARSSHGRAPIFATPEAMWSAILEYFAWNAKNPLYEAKAFSYEGEITIASLPKMRAMSINGLCNFLDIAITTWAEYRKREDFKAVTTQAETVIFQQKFEGASADLLNASIIARDLGLADKQELRGPGPNGEHTITPVDPMELARQIAFTLRAATEK